MELYFEDIETPFEPVYIHIPGHQPEMKRMTTEEARKHMERVEKARLMRLVWGSEALESKKKHFKPIEIL